MLQTYNNHTGGIQHLPPAETQKRLINYQTRSTTKDAIDGYASLLPT